jgi:hypothetical protein
MSRRLHLELDFPVSYEVEQLDRIDRSGGRRAYGFPDALLLDRQQELASQGRHVPGSYSPPEPGRYWLANVPRRSRSLTLHCS